MEKVPIVLLEIAILALVSRALIGAIAKIIGVRLTIALLFPGTVIHELAHLFVAEVLGVRTGRLTLTPEGLEGLGGLDGLEIRTGSVAIAKTDPVRRTIVGIAPVVAGMTAITAIAYFPNMTNTTYMTNVISLYLLFAVSNSMFSSREDMKGVVPVILTLGLFAAAGYAAGFRFSLTGQAELIINTILSSLVKSLGLVLAVNGVILLAIRILLAMTAGPRKMLPVE